MKIPKETSAKFLGVVQMFQRSIFRNIAIVAIFGTSACSSTGCYWYCPPENVTFNGISKIPSNSVAVMEGTAVQASIAVNSSTGQVVVGAVQGPLPAYGEVDSTESIWLNKSPDKQTGISHFISSLSPLVDLGNGTAIFYNQVYVQTDIVADLSTLGFEYQIFAASYSEKTFDSGVFAGSYGLQTSPASMPSSGSASYSGASAGFFADAGGQPFMTTSNIAINTDFSTATITSSATQKTVLDAAALTSAPNLDFTGTGAISANGFLATISGTDVSGTADGIFYGPNAVEVGGTFSSTGAGGTYLGAFGGN